MNAATILKINLDEPERLFDKRDHAYQYKKLAKEWHPDLNKDPKAADVFAHIGNLYQSALKKLAGGTWSVPGVLSLTGVDGKTRSIKYSVKKTFELGEFYVGNTLVTFAIARAHEHLVLAGLRCVGTIRYPTEDFRKSLEQYFPKVEHYFETRDHIVICVRKRKDEILLTDLLTHLKGKIDPKHVAWLMSSLFNLASFLQINRMCINGIDADAVYVSPSKHSVSILGGWWYAAEFDKPITTLPPSTYKLAPRKLLALKQATPFLDLESIRAIGRLCLGDITGNSFRMAKDLPAPMTSFLQLPSSHSAVADYEAWVKVLEDSFGPRKFVKLDVEPEHIYNKETA